MSRILSLIAAASLLSLAACQSAPEQTAQAEAKPAAETTAAAPAEAAPAPAAEQAPPAPAAEPAKSVSVPVKVEVAKPAPKPAPKVVKPAASATISKQEALALAGKGNCLACHKIEKKVVGPAWKDVAAKYKGKPDAAATIAAHIKKGGSFGWKFGNMPPRGGSKLSDADVAKLAGFIAGLK